MQHPRKWYITIPIPRKNSTGKALVTHSTSTLSGPDANGFRTYTMYLPLGTCCVYGVTYSNGEGLDLEEMLEQDRQKTAKTTTADIYNLQISNDYAHKDGADRHSQVYQRSHRICTQAGLRDANSTDEHEI